MNAITFAKAVHSLQTGSVVAIPTDTVYGIAASLNHPAAISRLYEIKGRDSTKAIAVLLADHSDLPLLTLPLPAAAQRLANCYWPGALTLVVPKQPNLPAELSPYPTLGVRMPNHPQLRQLLRQCGPLAVTSANRSGQPDSFTAAVVWQQLGEALDGVWDDGRTAGAAASTVVDCTSTPLRILRQGGVILSAEELAVS